MAITFDSLRRGTGAFSKLRIAVGTVSVSLRYTPKQKRTTLKMTISEADAARVGIRKGLKYKAQFDDEIEMIEITENKEGNQFRWADSKGKSGSVIYTGTFVLVPNKNAKGVGIVIDASKGRLVLSLPNAVRDVCRAMIKTNGKG